MSALPKYPKYYSVYIKRSDEKSGEREFVGKDKIRTENRCGGATNIRILRYDKALEWTLWPKDCTYLQTRFPKAQFRMLKDNPDLVWDPDDLFIWTREGSTRIDGRECFRYIGRFRDDISGKAHEVRFIDKKTKMYRRVVTYNKLGKKCLTIDYLDVQVGVPDPLLFEIPKGYRRVK
jgi:hypothetical protein